MHASMAKDDGKSSPAFPSRLLAVWRYVVVSVVTAVAVAVVIKTMSAGVLRHDNPLKLVVAQGSVQVDRIEEKQWREVGFDFGVTAQNQISRYVAYRNVSIRLFAGALTSDEADTIAHFNLSGPLVVPPNVEQDILVHNELYVLPRYVQTLYDEGVIAAAMRLDGDLDTNPEPNQNMTGVMDHHMISGRRPVTYYCWPLTVGYSNLHSNNDVSCVTA